MLTAVVATRMASQLYGEWWNGGLSTIAVPAPAAFVLILKILKWVFIECWSPVICRQFLTLVK